MYFHFLVAKRLRIPKLEHFKYFRIRKPDMNEITLDYETTEQAKPRAPDFIIGGAPKCGTTSLHFILNQHPDIAMPDNEILFHDADDPVVHPDFLRSEPEGVQWYNPEDTAAWDWYKSRFTKPGGATVTGEDSPTYLFSNVAAARISRSMPDVKVMFMLRNPVKRAYSQYWHLVKSGRATETFERAISTQPSIILGSTYAPHLRQYQRLIGPERVKVLIFEDFIARPQEVVDEVTDFIGVDRFPLQAGKSWYNKTHYPRLPWLHRKLNHVGRRIVATRYHNHFSADRTLQRRIVSKLHYWWFKHVNDRMLTADRAPRMNDRTRTFLEMHMSERNRGLSDILGRDIKQVWPWFSG